MTLFQIKTLLEDITVTDKKMALVHEYLEKLTDNLLNLKSGNIVSDWL